MQLTEQQQAAIDAFGHTQAVIGAPGTGKTTTLVEKAAHLLESGRAQPGQIFIAAQTLRSYLYISGLLKERLGNAASGIICGTLRDFAHQALTLAGMAKPIIDFPTMRRLIRQAMVHEEFNGTVSEAEQILRHFKAKAKKPGPNEPFVGLLKTYKDLLDSRGVTDQYDVVREHILAMRQQKASPCPAKFLLVNHVQDLTHLQFLWLIDHHKAGSELIVAGNDDQTAFGNVGAMGSLVFEGLEELDGIEQYDLSSCFRCPDNVLAAGENILDEHASDLVEEPTTVVKRPADFTVKNFKTVHQELDWLAKQAGEWRRKYGQTALIVHHDAQAYYLERALQEARQPHSLLAQSVWQTPGALLVMELLNLLLGTATADELRNFLYGMGCSELQIKQILASGVDPAQWLVGGHGADLPDLPENFVELYSVLHQQYQALQQRQSSPQEAFQTAADAVIEKLWPEDQETAVLAVDGLLALSGNPAQMIPKLKKRRPPDLNAPLIISTVSQARNLTFEHVVIPFMAKPVWPWTKDTVRGVNELNDRRLLYLALTRAARGITLSYSGTPSKFLADIKDGFEE